MVHTTKYREIAFAVVFVLCVLEELGKQSEALKAAVCLGSRVGGLCVVEDGGVRGGPGEGG